LTVILGLFIAAKLSFAKKAFVGLPTEQENLLELGANNNGVQQCPKESEWNLIMDYVAHEHAALNGLKKVFVVPNGVGSYALLVHKILAFRHMGNFCYPIHGNSQEGRNSVFNEQAWVHGVWHFPMNFKAKAGWGDFGQILGRRKKLPCLLFGYGQKLLAFNFVHRSETPIVG
jgi:hypothetical protein